MQKLKKQQLKTLKHLLKHNQIFFKIKRTALHSHELQRSFFGSPDMSAVCQKKMKEDNPSDSPQSE